jgi:hypothetical protein
MIIGSGTEGTYSNFAFGASTISTQKEADAWHPAVVVSVTVTCPFPGAPQFTVQVVPDAVKEVAPTMVQEYVLPAVPLAVYTTVLNAHTSWQFSSSNFGRGGWPSAEESTCKGWQASITFEVIWGVGKSFTVTFNVPVSTIGFPGREGSLPVRLMVAGPTIFH